MKALLRRDGDVSLRLPFLLSSPQDRVPFVVAERVPWEKMCETLITSSSWLRWGPTGGYSQSTSSSWPRRSSPTTASAWRPSSTVLCPGHSSTRSFPCASDFPPPSSSSLGHSGLPQRLPRDQTAGIFTMPHHVHQEGLCHGPGRKTPQVSGIPPFWSGGPPSSLFASDLHDSPRLCVNTALVQNDFDPLGK